MVVGPLGISAGGSTMGFLAGVGVCVDGVIVPGTATPPVTGVSPQQGL